MIKKIIATIALLLATITSVQATEVIWSNFDLLWNGTGPNGGPVTIQSQEGLGSFEVQVADFSESYYWSGEGAPPPVENFLTSSTVGIEFNPWLAFMDGIILPNQVDISGIGSGYHKYPENPFSITEFREANWQVDDSRITSSIPEPTTSMLLLMGLAGLMVFQKKRIAAKG